MSPHLIALATGLVCGGIIGLAIGHILGHERGVATAASWVEGESESDEPSARDPHELFQRTVRARLSRAAWGR